MATLQDETCLQIRNLLGEERYCQLIKKLPDAFFRLCNDDRKSTMKKVLEAVLHKGQCDPEQLAGIVRRETFNFAARVRV